MNKNILKILLLCVTNLTCTSIYAQVTATILPVTNCKNNGSISLSGVNSSTFSYNWSYKNSSNVVVQNFASTANLQNLAIGTYCVTVLDANCCAAKKCFEVKDESKQLTFNTISSTTPASSCGVADGTITLTQITANGVAPYTYEWFKVGITGNTSIGTGQNPAILKNLLQGVYYVVAKDANGCKGSSPDFFVLAPNNKMIKKKINLTVLFFAKILIHLSKTPHSPFKCLPSRNLNKK